MLCAALHYNRAAMAGDGLEMSAIDDPGPLDAMSAWLLLAGAPGSALCALLELMDGLGAM